MRLLLIFITTLITIILHGAPSYVFEPGAGKVEFKTKGWPSLITIKGEGQGVIGSLEEKQPGKISGTLSFDLNTLKTGIELRDQHMKEKYLEVKDHPKAKLTITELEAPKSLSGELPFKGQLKLHGVEKAVSGTAKLEKDGDKLSITAELPLKLTDFKVAIPSYKGITVAEKVTVHFQSQVKTQ